MRGVTRARRLLGRDWNHVQLLSGQAVMARENTPGWGRVVEHGWYELDTELFLAATLRVGQVVVDVGSNEGVLSVVAAKHVGNSGRVIAFDADPDMVAAARKSARKNNTRNLAVHLGRIGDGSGGSIALDDTVEHADLLKIDVDGPELLVLNGALRLLATRPSLVVELSSESERFGYSWAAIVSLLRSLGYSLYASRMKFAHVLPLDDSDAFARLPVTFDEGDVANLFATRTPIDARAVWPANYVPDAYHRHFLSGQPFETTDAFWSAYDEQIRHTNPITP